MKIFIAGATGFIGNAAFHALVPDHAITLGSRTRPEGYENWKQIDFSRENNWNEILEGIDLVINAIGIIEGDFEQVQTKGPHAMFEACRKKGIRIINISAVGAEKENPGTPFLNTKKETDQFLLKYEKAHIIYPGIAFGKGALSTQFFAEMVQFPVVPIPKGVTPPSVHISQLARIIKDVAENFEKYPQQIFAVSKPEPLEKLLTAIRGKSATFIKMPVSLMTAFFTFFPHARIGIFNISMLKMLSTVNAYDYQPMCDEASAQINSRELVKSNYFIKYIALFSVAFVWIWSGVSSFVSWDESRALMKEVGASDFYSSFFIYAGGITDLVLGLAIFHRKRRRQVIILQLLVVTTYMLILTVLAPSYWMHPFGVLSKNIPLIALSVYLYQRGER